MDAAGDSAGEEKKEGEREGTTWPGTAGLGGIVPGRRGAVVLVDMDHSAEDLLVWARLGVGSSR